MPAQALYRNVLLWRFASFYVVELPFTAWRRPKIPAANDRSEAGAVLQKTKPCDFLD